MAGFRRAQLRGSEELFRSTDPNAPGGDEATQAELPVDGAEQPASQRQVAPSVDGNLLRLTDEEITVLADAIQRVKFPGKASGRPSVDDFERLEELRQKLLAML